MDPLARPIFIVAPPQSGSSFLYRALGQSPSVRRLEEGERAIFDLAEELDPASRGHDSNRRTADDATPEASVRLRERLQRALSESNGSALVADPPPRMLDATPRHALRVPYLDAVFGDAAFVYLYREPRDTVAGMVEAWESGSFVTYPNLPDWPGPPWSMLLVPGWRELADRPVAEIAGEQWLITTRTLLEDLERLEPQRWCVSDFAALVAEPQRELRRLCSFLGLEWEGKPVDGDPMSHVVSPSRRTQEEHSERLQAVMPRTTGLAERARDLIASPVSRRPTPTPDADSPLRSVYTGNFPRILGQLGASLLVSTYGTGKLVCMRRDRARVNTHFRNLRRPTGIAVTRDRLAVGARAEVWDYRNSLEAAERLERAEPHDACYLPRNRHYTGDAGTRELGFAGDELWFVASRFDCLATLDQDHSLLPRWQPPFVSELADGDRCHLTGLAIADDEVAYVTALGETDEPDGWRERKLDGGCVIAVDEDRVVARGLSLPHSPRWHRDRLWALESGTGTMVAIDPESGEKETVAELPGFARGLGFADRLAFVGVSQLREGPDGAGLPVAEHLDEQVCGVWVVDIERGETAGFVRFEEQVQEIFDVAVVPWYRFPEIAGEEGEATLTAFALPEEAVR
ncbi:MAG: TIGR03032 family protein [Solirubrobacterales bacterium]